MAGNPPQTKPGSSGADPGELRIDVIIDEVSNSSFRSWYDDREFRQNIREGKPYFNGPGTIHPPQRHSPSSLLQCHRKVFYKQLNAPREEPSPQGLFWFGTHFEEDIIEPFLADVTASDVHVTNSMWVDFESKQTQVDLRIKGVTDPVIVDLDGEPLVPTEIKTKQSLEHLEEPNAHHRAQLHAYMQGLTEMYDRRIDEGLLVYGGRTHLDLKVFQVPFDLEFWQDTVLSWAETHTEYRLDDELPPADPESDWECGVCDYKERCGRGDREIEELPATGLIPLFSYPQQQLVDYLSSYDAELTPALAHHHPELVPEYGAMDWRCRGCGETYHWDAIEWSGDVTSPPKCPACKSDGTVRFLSGPMPENQLTGGM